MRGVWFALASGEKSWLLAARKRGAEAPLFRGISDIWVRVEVPYPTLR
jgi:hypothetical protein